MERNHILDILRGIAILFVILGHITRIPELQTYIWGFHLPLFFVISGYLFDRNKYRNNKQFIVKKIKNLLIPYAFFYIVTFLYWVFIERNIRGSEYSITSQLIGLIYGKYSLDYMGFNGALWFIPCLFSIEIIYWFISKIKSWSIIILLVLGLNIFAMSTYKWIGGLPFGICPAMIAVCFYSFGNLIRIHNLSFKISIIQKITLIFILFITQYALLPVTGARIAGYKFVHPELYILISCIGIIVWYLVAQLIKKNIILEFLGRNSLVLFAFQEPVYRVVIYAGSFLLNIEIAAFRNNILCCLGATVVTIILITPLIYGYNRWINPLLKRI